MLHLAVINSFQCMKMHGLTNAKFVCDSGNCKCHLHVASVRKLMTSNKQVAVLSPEIFLDLSATWSLTSHYPSSLFYFNPLNPKLNPICYLLALLGARHFLHVSRIRVKSLTFKRLMSYIYGAPILDVSRSHTTTQHSR